MTVSIEIRPHSDSVDMYGEPDKSTAYSLSGDIAITISSAYSLFERRRAVRLLLRSLVIDFEGQCELITEDTGYVPFRLCNVSKELILGEAIELSNEGHEDDVSPSVWVVAFNLVIPGWLPHSAAYGDCEPGEAGTRYGLYATAQLLNIDEGTSRSLFSFCTAPFRSQMRTLSAPRCAVTVNRFIGTFVDDPSSSTTTLDYTVVADQQKDASDASNPPAIPYDVISKLRVVMSVPEYVDTSADSFPICLRMRTQDLTEAQCKRLRVTSFDVEVEQVEQCRVAPSESYEATHPLPPASHQPPVRPLRSRHRLQAIYDIGLACSAPTNYVHNRSLSLLPEGTSGRYSLAGDGYIFQNDTDPDFVGAWYYIRTDVPCGSGASKGKTASRARESGQSPLFCVAHKLHVRVACTYDGADGAEPERATEYLRFQIPLRFVRMRPAYLAHPPPLSPSALSQLSGHSSTGSLDSLSSIASSMMGGVQIMPAASLPCAPSLPAYSQLFDRNGDRKIDYSVPLPAYSLTPPCSPSPSSSVTSLESSQLDPARIQITTAAAEQS